METVRYLSILCFAILAATVVDGMTAEMRKLLYPSAGFLIGEETPVYLADRPNDGEVVYTKSEKGIVKKALDRWEKAARDNRRPSRQEVNFTKRDSDDIEPVLYPTILVVLDYGNSLPNSNPDKEQEIILDRIIYAMAYFNDVDIQLRNIQYIKLPLRIAAIIINRSFKNSWPYMKNIDDDDNDGPSKALNPMLKYWRDLAKTSKTDFPTGSYDIVVHLKNSNRKLWNEWVDYTASSSTSPPCNQEGKIAGLIVDDNLSFDSVRTTVTRMSYIFGDTVYTRADTSYFKDWTPESSTNIYNALKKQTCMAQPKEHHPPGKPVATILPGEIYSEIQQCHAHGWNEDNKSGYCWMQVRPDAYVKNCYWLRCTNPGTDLPCRSGLAYSNPTLTGTLCNHDTIWTGICVQGNCVKL